MYAPYIILTKATRMERFRKGLITPLYITLAAAKFPTLSRLIDKAKLLEARHKEDKAEREQRKQLMGKTQSS